MFFFYLHATDSYSKCSRRALFTFLHLSCCLLFGGVISVLPGAHFQVKDTGVGEVMYHILQKQKLWRKGCS